MIPRLPDTFSGFFTISASLYSINEDPSYIQPKIPRSHCLFERDPLIALQKCNYKSLISTLLVLVYYYICLFNYVLVLIHFILLYVDFELNWNEFGYNPIMVSRDQVKVQAAEAVVQAAEARRAGTLEGHILRTRRAIEVHNISILYNFSRSI